MRKNYTKKFFAELLKLCVDKAKLYNYTSLQNALDTFNDDFYAGLSHESYCCGVMTFGELGGSENLHELVYEIATSFEKAPIWKYYSVFPNITTLLKSIGFKQDRVFRNPNSGNMITELTYDATKEGELWWPTFSDMKDALGVRAVTLAESILTARNTASPAKTTKRRRT